MVIVFDLDLLNAITGRLGIDYTLENVATAVAGRWPGSRYRGSND